MGNLEIEKVLIGAEEIQKRVTAMGRQIATDYAGKDLLCVAILRGSFIFLADLVRAANIPSQVDFIRCSSYGNRTTSSGRVEIEFFGQPVEIRGRHVLIVDDILDAGWTLKKVSEQIAARGAASVKTCVLLDKPSRRATPLKADYCGFSIDDHFVVGYGMDFQERHRSLPYVAVLAEQKTKEVSNSKECV